LKVGKKDVDARDKRGHDAGEVGSISSERALAFSTAPSPHRQRQPIERMIHANCGDETWLLCGAVEKRTDTNLALFRHHG